MACMKVCRSFTGICYRESLEGLRFIGIAAKSSCTERPCEGSVWGGALQRVGQHGRA